MSNDGSRPERAASHRAGAERLIDEVMPEGIEWERLVRSYPIPSLLLAAAGGCWLGLRHGSALVAAGSAYASRQAARGVREALGEDVDLDG